MTEKTAETDRLEKIIDYNDCFNHSGCEQKPDLSPGSYSYHEIVHSSLLQTENFERALLDHPALFHDPELYAKASEISEKMGELYQALANKHLSKKE